MLRDIAAFIFVVLAFASAWLLTGVSRLWDTTGSRARFVFTAAFLLLFGVLYQLRCALSRRAQTPAPLPAPAPTRPAASHL